AAKVQRYLTAGYRRVDRPRVFQLGAGKHSIVRLNCTGRGAFALVAVSQGAADIDLAVYNEKHRMIARDFRINTDPEVQFRSDGPGVFWLVVINPSDTNALVVLEVLEK